MKLHERSTQRFVKEYANWKISILEDMAKCHPEKAAFYTASATIVRETYKKWENGLVMTDEAMRKISDF